MIKRITSIIAMGFALIVLSLAIFTISGCGQRLFYYPDETLHGRDPHYFGQTFQPIQFNSEDGTALTGWFIPAQTEVEGTQTLIKADATVIFAHGNAANISLHYNSVSWLPAAGFNVFIFDYRGFGQSEGTPSFEGTMEDTKAAIEYVRNMPEVDATQLIVFGQSIGGTQIISALGESSHKGIRAAVIDSTFYSHSQIASYYFKGVGFLIPDRYSASESIKKLAPIPLLFIHGTADRVIPYQHTEKLFQKASDPKELLLVPELQHMETTADPMVQQKIIEFIRKSLKVK